MWLKNFFNIPDTFDPDDRRQRHVLNFLLSGFIFMALVTILLITLSSCCLFHDPNEPMNPMILLGIAITIMVAFGILLAANRSAHIPSWLNGTIFIVLIILLITQVDTPSELYNGRSTIAWGIPIVIAAVIFHPNLIFLIMTTILVLMELFTPPNSFGYSQVNYYSMIDIVSIAFISWLGMSIANRAIRDARREAANNKAILDNIADGVLVLDQQGNMISTNPALRRMIVEEDLRKIITMPLSKTVQLKHQVFSVTSSPVPTVGTVAVFRDETRRQETERAKDALLATASHELRTPLAATMNYLELMLMMIKLDRLNPEEFKLHLTRALENSKRLQTLINNILDQAQIQAGMLELKHQLFDLPSLLEKTRQLLETLLVQKSLSYEITLEPNVPTSINSDPDRLHQVLVNLIGNAIKFTSQGGIKVHVSAPEKKMLSIEVSDTGAGIPPEQLPDIFEAFRRGSDYAQRERQGAGLGLSIVKEIVTRMGGQVSVTSQVGAGSRFTVTLPVDAA